MHILINYFFNFYELGSMIMKKIIFILLSLGLVGCKVNMNTIQPDENFQNVAIVYVKSFSDPLVGYVSKIDNKNIGLSGYTKILIDPGEHILNLRWGITTDLGLTVGNDVEAKSNSINAGPITIYSNNYVSKGHYSMRAKLKAGHSYVSDSFSLNLPSPNGTLKPPSKMCLLEYKHGSSEELQVHSGAHGFIIQSPGYPNKQIACGSLISTAK